MLKTGKVILAVVLLLTFWGCDDAQEPPPFRNSPGSSPVSGNSWLIPEDQIFDGGPGKDGIPALENPEMIPAASADFLSDRELVVGYKSGSDIRAYPHQILDWHEIANDEVDTTKIAVTYCPLTGTAIGWNRVINNETTTFGVSGLLYNTNLIPYDRLTDSNWSQMLLDCVNGELIGEEAATYQVIETTWGNWKTMFPNTRVLSRNTGFSRNYGVYPYGDYKTNNNYLLFPVSNRDSRLPEKERVLGVIVGDKVKIYRFDDLPENEVGIISDEFSTGAVVIVGSAERNFMTAYYQKINDETRLKFTPVSDGTSVILTDQEGNQWNVFGEAVSGPRKGQRLSRPVSFIGFWFAWAAFYPGLEIFEQPG